MSSSEDIFALRKRPKTVLNNIYRAWYTVYLWAHLISPSFPKSHLCTSHDKPLGVFWTCSTTSLTYRLLYILVLCLVLIFSGILFSHLPHLAIYLLRLIMQIIPWHSKTEIDASALLAFKAFSDYFHLSIYQTIASGFFTHSNRRNLFEDRSPPLSHFFIFKNMRTPALHQSQCWALDTL